MLSLLCQPRWARAENPAPLRLHLLLLPILLCIPMAAYASSPSGVLTSPQPGGTLSGSSVTFAWSKGTASSDYKLYVGTQGVGSGNLFNSPASTATSVAVSNLPKAGLTLYVRLYSLIQTQWVRTDYTYTEAGTPVAPVMTSPKPGSTLSGSSVTFSWSTGTGPSAYKLYLGNEGAGSSNLYNSGSTTATSLTVGSLPESGATLYVELSWLDDTTWQSASYTYTEAGAPVLSGLSCQSTSLTGAGTDTCTVTLNKTAPSGGFAVNLASSDAAVSVPASVTVASAATSASFSTTDSAVTSAQTATLTASAGGISKTLSIQLNAYVATLSINATSIAFGDVDVDTPATQALTLTSTGAAPVTVGTATISGTGFTFSGATFPLTLDSKQAATLNVQFDPTTAGAASGELTISSNSSSSPTAEIALTGTGEASAATYDIGLSWSAPSSSTDPVAGYNIYRAPSGSSSYALMGSVTSTKLSYTDSNDIQDGQTYDYIVESVDAAGNKSVPSNIASVKVP